VLRVLLVVLLVLCLAAGCLWGVTAARGDIQLVQPREATTPVRGDGALVFALRFADRDIRAAIASGPLPAGRHRIELRAVDAGGNVRVVRRGVTVVVTEQIHWRRSRALGTPNAGRLQSGVRLPASGLDFFTWDPVRDRRPDRPDRRWGTSRLVRTILDVPHAHRHANPNAPRVGVGDLSPRGGGRNPRRDRRLRAPAHSWQIDRALAQDLVDRFVRAVAERIFVDTRLGLGGPPGVVQHWPNHGDYLHLRLHGDQNRWAPGDSPRGRRAEATAPAGAAVSGVRPRAPGRAPG
jgi:hypothetical protein